EVVARGEEGIVIRRLHDAAAEVVAAGERPCLAEDHFDRLDSCSAFRDEPGAGERGARAALDRLRVTEIDRVVLREAAVEHDVEQTSLPGGENLRHAGKRGGERAVNLSRAAPCGGGRPSGRLAAVTFGLQQ